MTRRRDVAWMATGSFLGNALFPRLAHRTRWPSRLRGHRLLLWIGLDTGYRWAILESIAVMRRADDKWQATAEAMRRELGREPRPEEIRNRILGLPPGAEFP